MTMRRSGTQASAPSESAESRLSLELRVRGGKGCVSKQTHAVDPSPATPEVREPPAPPAAPTEQPQARENEASSCPSKANAKEEEAAATKAEEKTAKKAEEETAKKAEEEKAAKKAEEEKAAKKAAEEKAAKTEEEKSKKAEEEKAAKKVEEEKAAKTEKAEEEEKAAKKAEEKAAAMTVEEAKPAEANLAEQKPAEEDKPDSEPRDGAQFASVAERHAKLALDPNGLVRVGKFGDIALFDSRLEEHVGFMDAKPLRGLYGEHVISVDSTTVFSPPNNPGLSCTPMGELAFVVGENGIDTETWELKADARPAQHGPHMVQGRNAKSIAELVESQEAKDAGLHDAEIVALRLYTGEIS